MPKLIMMFMAGIYLLYSHFQILGGDKKKVT